MTTIAFLGTGLMGTGFIQRARANGLTVRAWNRTAAKAQALAAIDAAGGVTACATVAQAVQGAERVAHWDTRAVRYVHAPVFMAPAHLANAWRRGHRRDA